MFNNKNINKILLSVFIYLGFAQVQVSMAGSISSTIINADYKDVRNNIIDSIEERALNIAKIFHASDMLKNTKGSFSFIRRDVFRNAEIIEFCSASISQELIRDNHLNILLCPFRIAIYNLEKDPSNVHVVYNIPKAIDKKSKKTIAKLSNLISAIVADAAW